MVKLLVAGKLRMFRSRTANKDDKMSNAIVSMAGKLASKFDMAEGGELLDALKATAFRGQVSDAQMMALRGV